MRRHWCRFLALVTVISCVQVTSRAALFAAGRSVQHERLSELIRNVAEQSFPGCEVQVEIVRVAGEVPPDLSPGHVEIRSLMRLNPGVIVPFEIRGRAPVSSALRSVVSARLRVFRPTVVAVRDIPAGSILTAGDVTVERREISRTMGEPLLTVQQVVGKVARGTIRKGDILTTRLLREAEAVRRGDPVRIVVVKGPVQIETPGMALQSGSTGEEILVRSGASGRTIRAIVAGPGEVEIRL